MTKYKELKNGQRVVRMWNFGSPRRSRDGMKNKINIGYKGVENNIKVNNTRLNILINYALLYVDLELVKSSSVRINILILLFVKCCWRCASVYLLDFYQSKVHPSANYPKRMRAYII